MKVVFLKDWTDFRCDSFADLSEGQARHLIAGGIVKPISEFKPKAGGTRPITLPQRIPDLYEQERINAARSKNRRGKSAVGV